MYSIIIPAYNEEAVLEESYKRLKNVMDGLDHPYELIFVNDGSADRTADLLDELYLKDPNVKVIDFLRNFGHQLAVTAGLDYASGHAVIIIDCDLQDPPEVIPKMIGLWKQGFDVVYGKRLKRKGETIFKKLSAFVFYRFLKMMSSQPIPADTGDFRLIDRRVVEAMRHMRENNRFLRGMVSWLGFKQTAVEYVRDERWAGETKYPLKKMVKLAGDGITSFSNKPLKLPTIFGTVLCVLSVLMAIVFIILFSTGVMHIRGWLALVCVFLFIQGITMIMMGIQGSYLGRIYDEAKARPLYLLNKAMGFSNEIRSEPVLSDPVIGFESAEEPLDAEQDEELDMDLTE